MSHDAITAPADAVSPPAPIFYARFGRRLKAMFLDWVLMLALIFGALTLASLLSSEIVARSLGFLVVAILLLYEPLLVAYTGGTLGHRWTNLRVVDERHGGNIGLPKAVARMIIKGVLGVYSFIVMAATRRNQAVHDLLTRSTVRIRDTGQAAPGQYITERTELRTPGMPSPVRRVAVICVYLALGYVILGILALGLVASGSLTESCLNRGSCPGWQAAIRGLFGLTVIAAAATIMVQGWRGRLVGARRRAAT